MKKIAIIGALESEVKLLKDELSNLETIEIAGNQYFSGMINNTNIVLTKCGIGKVSASICTQIMITKFNPDYVINTGCAGAIDKNLKIGDFVISKSAIEWDIDIQAIGFPRGYISALNQVEINADEYLIKQLEKVFSNQNKLIKGLIVSGDQFISTNQQRELILNSFPKALCAEMEGASVAHVCAQNQVPFCIIRCMSDTADGNSGVNYEEFSAIAGEKSAKILIEMLKGW
ncbi:MAG: 5'-methylthioadenosine/adenosylhomocysteine nucleosidase [Bacteroidales bacterium]|nr:5'-methylthioadenosine/adenosylhomocysteine nucleosidase [Bacteroidales bacterium]